jgi:hypothetical protein
VTPSVAEAIKAKRRAEEYRLEEQEKASRQLAEEEEARRAPSPEAGDVQAAKPKQQTKTDGERSGVKVGSSSILYKGL